MINDQYRLPRQITREWCVLVWTSNECPKSSRVTRFLESCSERWFKQLIYGHLGPICSLAYEHVAFSILVWEWISKRYLTLVNFFCWRSHPKHSCANNWLNSPKQNEEERGGKHVAMKRFELGTIHQKKVKFTISFNKRPKKNLGFIVLGNSFSVSSS